MINNLKYFIASLFNKRTKSDYYTDKELKYLSDYVKGTFSINSDGFIDVNGDVNLVGKKLISIPFKFGKVTGYFDCCFNKLTSLRGCPYYVGGYFACDNNKLTSLKHAPKYVGGHFNCHSNNRKFSKIEILKHVKVIGIIIN